MKNKIINISIISHNQSNMVLNIVKDLRKYDFISKVYITINTYENIKEIERIKNFPIEIIINKNPKGFGQNHNYAYTLSKCDYFIIINPDVRLKKLNFESLFSYFKLENVELVTPVAVDEKNNIQDNARKFPSFITPFIRKFGIARKDYLQDLDEYTNVDWVSGMFMIIKSKTFEKIKGFDEKFFMYYEDVDFCRRIKNSSGKILRINTEKVFHIGQHQSHKSLKYLFIHIKSMLYYHMKYFLK